ncbi:hypothetical protein [Confluentibacter sediminis]|uniref:hypothetical protein n=1 Tax=Confluentibacter sediminis TaxID=2219045 RepID=UPI000DABEA2D|nr:hypothetical protein [Confluentibacter sediminis]
MIDQKSRLRENGKNFAPRFSGEVEKSLKRTNTVFTITSSENNHNTTFLKEFQKDLIGSMKRQSMNRSSCSIFFDVKREDTLEDTHYVNANFNVILKSLVNNYNSLTNQIRRLDQKTRFGFMVASIGIISLLIISSYQFNVGKLSTPTLQQFAGIFLSVLGVLSFFTFIPKNLKSRIEKKKQQDDSFSFEKERIIRYLNKRGFRKKPTVVVVDNAELLDEEPYHFLLDLMNSYDGANRFGCTWVFLFTSKSDNLDDLMTVCREKHYVNYLLELKPYNNEELREIIGLNPELDLEGNYLISKDEKRAINQLKKKWTDQIEKNDNKNVFSEYDILKFLAFSGNRHHIERWNSNKINELFINTPKNIITSLNSHLCYTMTNNPDYFELATRLKQIEDFFQSRHFATGAFVIPYKLRIILESSLDKSTLILIQLFWIKKYLRDYVIGMEDLLAKRILYRINFIKQNHNGISNCEELLKEIHIDIVNLLDSLFSHLSFRTFQQFFKALNQLNSLIKDESLTLIEREKLAYYSAYLFELSGDAHFELDELLTQEESILSKRVFSAYRRLLAKEQPLSLLSEIESLEDHQRIKEKPWLSNLYYLLLLHLRIREADGFVFQLRKDLRLTDDLALPLKSDFPIFEMRYRFLLLDVYLEQEKIKLFLSTLDSLVKRVDQIETHELALRTLRIYWNALAVHYWLCLKQSNSSHQRLHDSDFNTLFHQEGGMRESYEWVANQYIDCEFLFNQLELKLPLVDLYYSQARLIQSFSKVDNDKISEWYTKWHSKFKASVSLQLQINISFNIPEIYARIFTTKQSFIGGGNSDSEIKALIEILKDHNFDNRIILYWIYRERRIQHYLSSPKRLELTKQILVYKDQKNYLSYAYDKFETTNNDKLIEIENRFWEYQYLKENNDYEESKAIYEKLNTEFLELLDTSELIKESELKFINELDTILINERIELSPELANQIFHDLKKDSRIYSSMRFLHLLSVFLWHIPKEEIDFDLLNFYIKTTIKTLRSNLDSTIISECFHIIDPLKNNLYVKLPSETKQNIRKFFEAAVESEKLIDATGLDRLEEYFADLMTLESSEEFYSSQWHKWSQLRVESFIVSKFDEVYHKKSSHEIFQIYIDFFKRYNDRLKFKNLYNRNLLETRDEIVNQYDANGDPKIFATAVLNELKQNRDSLISSGEVNRIVWEYSRWLNDFLHYLDESDKTDAKEVLEEIFSPTFILDYLYIVKNIKSLPNGMKETISELIARHKANEYKLRG